MLRLPASGDVRTGDAEGEEAFDITVCTPAWLGKRVGDVGMIFGRHYLVVNDYDVEAIRLFLVKNADTCSAPTWSDVGAKLSQMLHWEFEDYVPYRGSDERM